MTLTITNLAQKAWDEYEKRREEKPKGLVIAGICPILYFGDYCAYQKSSIKIVTVGLNPSGAEFMAGKGATYRIDHRFKGASKCPPDYDGYLQSLNEYFYCERNPYSSWFSSFEHILKGMGASYYPIDGTHRVVHTDICSPLATAPTWSSITKKDSEEKSELQRSGRDLWCKLIEELKPNIILISVAGKYLPECTVDKTPIFQGSGEKQIVKSGIFKLPNHSALIIIGRTVNKPFGAIGEKDKICLGKKIMEYYHNGFQSVK